MRIKFISIIILVFAFCGCNENPPEIRQVFWQFNVFHDQETGGSCETLSLYVLADDKDGTNDIESMYLINDAEELYWKISGSDLHIESYGDSETWIGCSNIRISGCISGTGELLPDSHIPDGPCRIILIDSSGERDETSVTLKNGIQTLDHKWPALTRNGNVCTVSGDADFIWGFSADHTFVSEFSGKSEQTITNKTIKNFYLYRFLPEQGIGLINGPF
ncbi:MAG: hypothetical protein MJ215_03780 [Spirochaetia bacterium]|nr:hypothetical protein [Spirochaetia bacterium]